MRRPSVGEVSVAVGKVTFLEIIRDRVLYNVIVAAFLLFGITMLASRLAVMSADRVLLDFGLSAVTLSCGLVGLLTGAALLNREIERRTIFVALSHPISPLQFVTGKFAGLAAVVILNWALLAGIFSAMLLAVSERTDVFTGTLLAALALGMVQSLVLGALAIFFSSFSTTSVSVMMTSGLYLVGINASEMRLLAARMPAGLGRGALEAASWIVPNFEHFNLGLKVTYGLPVGAGFVISGLLYASAIASAAVLAAGLIVKAKEI